MSTSQDQYISSLKKIKKVEEDAQKEIDSYKSKIEDQIIQLDSELEQAIAAAKSEGEKLVDSNVEKATKKANAETQKTIEESKRFLTVTGILGNTVINALTRNNWSDTCLVSSLSRSFFKMAETSFDNGSNCKISISCKIETVVC